MKAILFSLFVVFCVMCCDALDLSESSYTQSMFNQVVEEETSAHTYVLVTLIDMHGNRSLVCIYTGRLIGAIMIENGMRPYNDSTRSAVAIAKSTRGREFRFKNLKAIEFARPLYTQAEYRIALDKFSHYTRGELVRKLKKPDSDLSQFYRAQRTPEKQEAYRSALAGVLLSKGISVQSGDYGSDLGNR